MVGDSELVIRQPDSVYWARDACSPYIDLTDQLAICGKFIHIASVHSSKDVLWTGDWKTQWNVTNLPMRQRVVLVKCNFADAIAVIRLLDSNVDAVVDVTCNYMMQCYPIVRRPMWMILLMTAAPKYTTLICTGWTISRKVLLKLEGRCAVDCDLLRTFTMTHV